MLGALPAETDPRVLVDYRTADDAGVYRIDEHRAIVQTVDFFTPIVDDPRTYGRIAAANAVSDVYAMGGRPMTALAIAAFPKDGEASVLSEIFRGGLEILRAADIALLGGHTVQDQEIKFGYAVTGEVDPERLWTNAGAKVGDRLFLTKPLGTGIITTALKFDRAPEAVAASAIASMTITNRAAAEALGSLPPGSVHACTDITGFGLAGHGIELARASGCSLELDLASIPVLEGALDLLEENTPGGARTNTEHFASAVDLDGRADLRRGQLLFDPQTSGGLLVVLAPDRVEDALRAFDRHALPIWPVGRVLRGPARIDVS